ncbi:MAG TPA: 30S ribosomal protein S8 [Candidatus Stercoripulliclostridium merdipullorum]|uniref:Small ribosomal subunit protein uS8 n=1 Tax=Candidatus Stercoripulliclostridium merdipullorum TaxID=2840952 RepID=A0A9D1NAZ0_9FIRM|nr:30S ribosomal protein S8 [Candidatus Stercoripulliclostridium merdipullorum]
MSMTDPIADMLTRIRNGLTAKHESVDVPASKIKVSIAEILVEEGFIKSATVVKAENQVQDTIHIELKYTADKQKVINGLKRISKPGLRIYAKSDALPKVLNGMGIAIISTSKGVMTDKKARAIGAGGEVLAYIW